MKNKKIGTICVYAAASSKIKQIYKDEAKILGKICAVNDICIVYGAGNSGLMGELANSCLDNNGKIIGVIPKFMYDMNWGHISLTELIVTNDIHERKKKMADLADAIVALPGGAGTMEELLEIITWKKIGLYTKPVVIVNIDGYYDHLIAMLENAVKENFMSVDQSKYWTVVNNSQQVLDAILKSPESSVLEARSFEHMLVSESSKDSKHFQ